jgi:hypothetical protein
MPLLPNRRGEQIKKERAGKASIRSHVTLIADFINAIGHLPTCRPFSAMSECPSILLRNSIAVGGEVHPWVPLAGSAASMHRR